MHQSPLTPIFAGLQLAMHVLVVALVSVVFLRAVLLDAPDTLVVATLAVAFTLIYLGGVTRHLAGAAVWIWLTTLTVLWSAMLVVTEDAAYLAFGMFFLYLRLVPRPWSLIAVTAATVLSITGTGVHRGWSVAGVIGPVLGASVALVIGLGYQSLYREATERQRLIDELVSTREVLAAQERSAGKLAERERLAQEIHDTVAQGLSSIQMLLHAVQRAAPDHPALDQLVLARETAADNLAETRQLIAELTPAALEGQSLADALDRICRRAGSDTLSPQFVVEGEAIGLPMAAQAAIVRIVQGAVSNVVRHAHATRMAVTLTYTDECIHLDIVDNGTGFDTRVLDHGPSHSFGLDAMRRRVAQLAGAMGVESEPGHTAVSISIPSSSSGEAR